MRVHVPHSWEGSMFTAESSFGRKRCIERPGLTSRICVPLNFPLMWIYPVGRSGRLRDNGSLTFHLGAMTGAVSPGVLRLEPVPRPMRDAEAVGHFISGPMVARHRCRGGPSEVVVQNLSQNSVAGKSDIGQSLVETSNRAAIHFLVLPVPAVHLDDGGFVSVGIGIRCRSTENLSPISCEPIDMLGVEAVAEGMGHHLVGHHATMPSIGKTAQAVASTRRLENSLHAGILTITQCLCKAMTAASSGGRHHPTGTASV